MNRDLRSAAAGTGGDISDGILSAVLGGDGLFVVGLDVGPGVYRTAGPVGGHGSVSLLKSTSTRDVAEFIAVDGPVTITVGPEVRAVKVRGCQAWVRLGDTLGQAVAGAGVPVVSLPEAEFAVAQQARPGPADIPPGRDTESEVPAAGQEASDLDGWPPVSLAENDHILVWWLPDYDDLVRALVAEFQWAWRAALLPRLQDLIPETILRAWRDADPLCREYTWYNVLDTFAAARAKKLGIRPLPPRQIRCASCSGEFLEAHMPYAYILRLGADGLDVCETCMRQALSDGSPTATAEAVTAVLQALSTALQRPPRTSDLNGRLDFKGLPRDRRPAAVQALRVKPTVARVKELFGSWDTALAHAADSALVSLPAYEPVPPAWLTADREFTSNDPSRYLSAMGSLPEAQGGPSESYLYGAEVQSLLGTGYLALAEAALMRRRDSPFLGYLRAQLYEETARPAEATAVFDEMDRQWPDSQIARPEHRYPPRDLRTITSGPAFYQPLATLPRGNCRFVLVGGPMEYVDRRGEHCCVSGDPPEGGAAAEFSESIARMNAMVDRSAWIDVATAVGHSVISILARANQGSRPYGHLVSYITGPFRDAVKSLTGSPPKKIADDSWKICSGGRSGWIYGRNAASYVFNANAAFAYTHVEDVPAACIWGWPDRSDICLQAYLDTVAAQAESPVTVILPDVPALRGFARRYVRRGSMDRVERALMEEGLYGPGSFTNKRGYIASCQFAPQLIVHPDGTEDDGIVLTSALAYLSAHHTLRLSVWDVLTDGLLRAVATAKQAETPSFVAETSERSDMIRWYEQGAEFQDADALLRPYRPTLLDSVLSA